MGLRQVLTFQGINTGTVLLFPYPFHNILRQGQQSVLTQYETRAASGGGGNLPDTLQRCALRKTCKKVTSKVSVRTLPVQKELNSHHYLR
jgi:hypothetical protein